MADWGLTEKPRLGQFIDEGSLRIWGSIFQNEMEFHMMTRMEDGFCEMCDLKPTIKSHEEGYTQPGQMFHSRANQFKDSRFPNWRSKELFVDIIPYPENGSLLFRYKGEHNEMESLRQFFHLNLLAGTDKECQAYKDLVMSPDLQIWFQFGQRTRTISFKSFPSKFEPYLGDVGLRKFSDVFINTIHYGWQVHLSFQSGNDDVEALEFQVKLLENCLKKLSEPSDLNNLPLCKIQGYLGTQWEVYKSLDSNSFRAIFDDITQAARNFIRYKPLGIIGYEVGPKLRNFKKFKFSRGQFHTLAILEKIEEAPYMSKDFFELRHISPHDPFQLWKQIENLRKELLVKYNSQGIWRLNTNFETGLQRFQERLEMAMSDYRFERDDVYCIRRVLDDFLESKYSPDKTTQLLKEEIEKEDVSTLFKEAKRKGALDYFVSDVRNKHVILEFNMDLSATSADNWKLFLRLLEKRKINGKLMEQFFLKRVQGHGKTVIKQVNDDRTISDDVMRDLRNRHIRYRVTYASNPQPLTSEVSKRLFNFPCPTSWSGGCPTNHNRWACDVCKTLLRYEPSMSYVSCQCGLVPLDQLGFTCPDPKHAIRPYSGKIIEDKTPRGELICILIGETGSGKSNLINSMALYLSFGSFDEACQSQPTFCLIPTAYSRVSAEGDIQAFPMGNSSNEELIVEGHTHTLQPKSYVFQLDRDAVLRVVDTSGFKKEDSSQEVEESIVELIGHYGEIHAICFVIDSNEKKPSEALTAIYHRTMAALKCSNNTLFLFTNYKPEAVPARFIQQVKEMTNMELKNEDHFRLDNRAFPCLISRNDSTSSVDIIVAKQSWLSSSAECLRFTSRLLQLTPFTLPANSLPPLDRILPEEIYFKPEPLVFGRGISCNLAPNDFLCNLAQNLRLETEKSFLDRRVDGQSLAQPIKEQINDFSDALNHT